MKVLVRPFELSRLVSFFILSTCLADIAVGEESNTDYKNKNNTDTDKKELEKKELENNKNSETLKILEEVKIISERAPRHESIGRPDVFLSGEELDRKTHTTIGETLAHELGVHNTSYGPGVGLPVLRGLSGVRVYISEEGLKTWDASVLSPDHASTIVPSQARDIRVIRGPSTVLYGNGAIGGAVLVNSSRIAKELPEQKQQLNLQIERGEQEAFNESNRLNSAMSTQMRADKWVFYVDGTYNENKTVSIPGNDLDVSAVIKQFGFLEEELTPSDGFIPNSDGKNTSYSSGLSHVNNNIYWGFSYRTVENDYGIPSGLHVHPSDDGHNHGGAGAEADIEAIRIELEQERLQTQGGWLSTNNSWLQEVEWNVGYLDYQHREFELSATGTEFKNEVLEFKTTFFHKALAGWEGQWGIDFFDREFSTRGQENFVPPTQQKTLGIFLSETFSHRYGELQLGARAEQQQTEQLEPTAPFGTNGGRILLDEFRHNTSTFALGANFSLAQNHDLELNFSQSSRAPDIQELLALGPHLATYSYDIGFSIRQDGPLESEYFLSADIGWQWRNNFGEQRVYLFDIDAGDYIYQQRLPFFYDFKNSGANFFRASCAHSFGCLPVYEYQQRDAHFIGYEWQWLTPEWKTAMGNLQLTFATDEVRAEFDDGEDLPRIPPRRTSVEIRLQSKTWMAELRLEDVTAQNRPGELETETADYQKVGANIDYFIANTYCNSCVIRLKMRNLLNEDIRNATSFLRNLAPEPGREISLGVNLQF